MEVKEMVSHLLRAGLTEKVIGQLVLVNQSTISRILSGKIARPKPGVVVAIKVLFEKTCGNITENTSSDPSQDGN